MLHDAVHTFVAASAERQRAALNRWFLALMRWPRAFASSTVALRSRAADPEHGGAYADRSGGTAIGRLSCAYEVPADAIHRAFEVNLTSLRGS